MRRFVFGMALLSLAACSSHSNSNNNASAEACGPGIINGSCLSSSSPLGSSTVMILAEDNDSELSVCSGTLIDRRLVLTAQHCAQDMVKMDVVFSDHGLTPQDDPNGPYIEVDNSQIYSQTLQSDHDLAIVHLVSDAPSNYVTQPLPPASFDISVADSFTNVGYGITAENVQDAGVLRETTVPASALITSAALMINGQETNQDAGDMLMFSSPTTGVCHGDSGGPLYANIAGVPQIVGVAESVAPTDGNDDDQCHGVSFFVDLRTNLDWIQQASAQLLGGAQ